MKRPSPRAAWQTANPHRAIEEAGQNCPASRRMSPHRTATRSILAAVIAAVALAGCSGGAEGPDHRAVVQTLENWLSEMASGNNRGACDALTADLQTLIDQQLRMHSVHATCHTYAAKWTSPFRVPGHLRAKVKSAQISGTTGTAILQAPPDIQSEVKLQKIRGQWRIKNY